MSEQYATLADLYTYGAPVRVFGQLDDSVKNAALVSASAKVATFLRARYVLPLLTWDDSITEATCKIATYDLLSNRGYNPGAGPDENIRNRYNDALFFLEKVQKSQAHPLVTSTISPVPTYVDQPMVLSSSVINLTTGATAQKRGW